MGRSAEGGVVAKGKRRARQEAEALVRKDKAIKAGKPSKYAQKQAKNG